MDIFSKLKKTIADTADGVSKNVQNLAESAKNIKMDDAVKNLSKMGGDALDSIKQASADVVDNTVQMFAKKEAPNELITDEDALVIIYCMMRADGKISMEEIDKFDAIGLDIDKDFMSYREELISKCNGQIVKAENDDDRYDILHDMIRDSLDHSQNTSEGSIYPKLLLWNLVAIAYSEKKYSAVEKRLIRFITRQLDIDASVLSEMEFAVQTLMELESQEKWLRSTDRRFSEVEVHMNEIADRKRVIMDGIHDLLLD